MVKESLIAAMVLLLLLDAGAVGQEQLSGEQLHGCWRWREGGDSKANMEICFRKDLTAVYRRLERDGHGHDGLLEWYLKPGNILVIDDLYSDEQACGIVRATDSILHLDRCVLMGNWHRQCAQLNETGDGCRKSP